MAAYSANFIQKLISGFFRHALNSRSAPLSNSQIFSRNPHKHCLHLQSYPLEHRHHLPRHRVAAWQKRRTTQTADSSPLHRPPFLTPRAHHKSLHLRLQLRSNLHYSSEEHIYLESAVIEAAGPKLTFSSQNASSLWSRTPTWGFISISGLSRGGCLHVCVCVCVYVHTCGFLQSSAEVLGSRWCLADGEPAGFSVWVMPAVSIRPLQSVWRGLLDAA